MEALKREEYWTSGGENEVASDRVCEVVGI
jgi:hypothetical protein